MSKLIVAFAVAGLAFGLVASRVPGRGVQGAGIACFAMAGLLIALHGYRERSLPDTSINVRRAWYFGRGAQWAAASLAVLSLALLAVAVAWGIGAEQDLLRLLRRRPGIVLLPAGFSVIVDGIARLHGSRYNRSPHAPPTATWGSRVGAGFAIIVGALVALIGFVELVAPAAFDAGLQTLWTQVRARLLATAAP